jgi:hypothetical protein
LLDIRSRHLPYYKHVLLQPNQTPIFYLLDPSLSLRAQL